MSQANLSCKRISEAVDKRLLTRGWSLRDCAMSFNDANAKEIESGKVRLMTKDVVHRVRSNQFEVINDRVAKLCDFLEVDLTDKSTPSTNIDIKLKLQKEFEMVEGIVKKSPELEQTIKSFLRNIAKIAAAQEEHI
jgi:hypothetical protein